MNKHTIRILCILLMTAMFAAITACTQTGEQPEVTTSNITETSTAKTTTAVTTKAVSTTTTPAATQAVTTKAVEANPFEDFYEVSWIWGFCDTYVDGAYDELLLEDRYNIDLQVWKISYYDREGITMMLAAGDIPDFSVLSKSPFNPIYLYDEGFTRSIHIDMFKKYFPFYYELMEKNAPSSYAANNIPGTEEYYAVSGVKYTYKMFYNAPVFRLDWLENVGYSIPESELTPIILTDEKFAQHSGKVFLTNFMFEHDEMNDIFRAFTEDDPDGNGEDDTYAAVIYPHTSIDFFHELYWGMFGITPYDANYLYYDESTQNVVPYYAHTGFRDYMIWANQMHEKGYMRTATGEGAWKDVLYTTWMTGKVGLFTADRQYIMKPDLPEYSEKQPPQSLYLNGEDDSTFVVMPVLKGPGPEGTWGNRRYVINSFNPSVGASFLVGESVSDGELARIFTLWNDMYSDWGKSEFWDQIINGIEGIHYKWSGDPFNSTKLLTDTSKIPPKYRMAGLWGHYAWNTRLPVYDTEAYRAILLMQEENKWLQKYAIEPYKYIDIINMGKDMHGQYTQKWKEIGPTISTVVRDFATRSWNGELANINTEWEQYLNQLYSAGLDDFIDDYFNNESFKLFQKPILD